VGLPHSDIPGSKPAGGSPGLFAAIHVLHRLLVPRHPPCALTSSASRSFESTKPAGSMFSKNPCSFVPFSTSLGLDVLNGCICLLNYSSILQVRFAREGTKKGSTSVEPLRPREVVSDLCDWRLQLTDDSSLLESSRTHTPGNRQCARSAKMHYIPPPSTRASDFVLGRGGRWSRGDSNP
jgi:hypothetical protein